MSSKMKPYADRYVHLNGPGDQRPTALQILKDEDLVGHMGGMVALVTGGTSGIGLETARALHIAGMDVFFTARDMGKGNMCLDSMKSLSSGTGKLEVIPLNLDSLTSVQSAARDFLSRSARLDILVNNAGIMACPQSKTSDGFERQFGVNHLSPFLLTVLLLPTLQASSTPAHCSRVVNVSSTSHRLSRIRWDDYNFEEPGSYDPNVAYAQSKIANIWTANYIDRHYGASGGVRAFSLHPGGVWSGLQSFLGSDVLEGIKKSPAFIPVWQTAEQGAATSVWAAVALALEGHGGEYLAECGIADITEDFSFTPIPGAAPWAHNREGEDRLWALSEMLVGVKAVE